NERYDSSGWMKYPKTHGDAWQHTPWNVLIRRTGSNGATVLPINGSQQRLIQAIDFSPRSDFTVTRDGTTLIHMGDQRVEMFDLSAGKCIGGSPIPPGIRWFSEDVDGNIALFLESAEVRIYSTRNGCELARLANIGATRPIFHFDPKTKSYFAL